MSDTFTRQPLPLPNGHNKVLLHSCCAPCSGEVMEAMLASGMDYTIFFYNPNIHPLKEYELRKEECISCRNSVSEWSRISGQGHRKFCPFFR
jgi:predicted adenine nucleotide alpha hydrolase (AANH) superfamily ATPase